MRKIALFVVMVGLMCGLGRMAAADPVRFFLEVPGITGESTVPGHSNVIELISYSINGQELSTVKLTDGASPQLFLATANGTQFPTITLLLYDTAVPGPQPDSTVVFTDSLVSSFQAGGPGPAPTDQVTFSFATATPEPASLSVLGVAGMMLLLRRR
jgi:type VI protein secretion system component Hcp